MAYCDVCDRDFRNWHDADLHMGMKHGIYPQRSPSPQYYRPPSPPRYAEYCHDCNMGFGRGGLLSHYVNSPNHAWCSICRIDFDYHSALRDHRDAQHALCGICDTYFRNDVGLHEHRPASTAPTAGACSRRPPSTTRTADRRSTRPPMSSVRCAAAVDASSPSRCVTSLVLN